MDSESAGQNIIGYGSLDPKSGHFFLCGCVIISGEG